MSRNRGTVLVVAAMVILVFGGGIYLFNQLGPLDGGEAGRGGPGGGAQGIRAKIVGDLDPAALTGPEQRPDVGTSPQPTRLSPGATVSSGSGGGASARSGGGAAAPEVVPAACSASLLQSILGLGVTLLGGRSAC